jgi:DNA-binding PadR family transcriptional regulator
MSVKYGLLALVSEQPAHGYSLKTAFEQRTGGSWTVNIGQVYTTLQRLERDGLVEAEATPGDDGRNVYRATAEGRRQLLAWFDQPVPPEQATRDELAAKVLIAVASRDIDVTDIIQRQRRTTLEVLQSYTRRKALADPEQDQALVMMMDALIFKAEAEIRWLDACEQRLRASAAATATATRPTGSGSAAR